MISTGKALGWPERIMGPRRPVTADVFLTRRCNNACPYCTYARHERRHGDGMSEADFDRALSVLVSMGVRGVILTGGGEPTCSPAFAHACARMDELGVPYGINTNFNLYRECRPAYLKVSLDGWDEASYRAARGVDAFAQVRENVARYCAWRDRHSPDTRVGIQMVATDPEAVPRFWEANRDLPADYIVFRPVESELGVYYREPEDRARARAVAAAAEALRERDQRVVVNPKFGQLDALPEGCPANRMQIAVDERCQVAYCCHKPYEVVGSLFDPDILDRLDRWQSDMSLCDVPCRLTASNDAFRMVHAMRATHDAGFV